MSLKCNGMKRNQVATTIEKLESMIDQTISDLLDELFMDLEGAFAKVLTRNWIDSSESINTICVTVEDYTQASECLQRASRPYA